MIKTFRGENELSTRESKKSHYENSYKKDLYSKLGINISKVVIPFSKLCRNYQSPDIYSGNEKIPFVDRDPDYKRILRQEFSNNFHIEFKIFKPIVKFPSF